MHLPLIVPILLSFMCLSFHTGGSAAIAVAHELEELRIQKQKLQQEAKVLEAQVSLLSCHCFHFDSVSL